MTYMYNGTVSVPHNKLQTFLKTAEALKVKGIVDTAASDDSAVSDTSVSPMVSPDFLITRPMATMLTMSDNGTRHPAEPSCLIIEQQHPHLLAA